MTRTGLRIDEALTLTWDDIDTETGRLTINKTLVYPLNSTPYISTPKSKNSVREYFKEVCKRAELPVLSPHALKHSHAVHLLKTGANIKYVSERLGHARKRQSHSGHVFTHH
ncbi:site-specific integrase [Brevibacillus sp. FSL K6-0770]|uniref:Tyr recombinase domain-containing protein n=1 Tax=Brevibacillus parabrevis TaxID=54914 RepID=A0A4Y3PH43_BREPA|nr:MULTISPECIES: site-specific integrase [Brevibacillus]MDH6350554.1 integrase [Brevibacillus sp. 1238]GEB32617.1 hypothetical protein BPA01_21970 [Brevibacillus parabrevis]